MTRAIKIENLTELDKTAAQVLRVISLHIGERPAARVEYDLIAKSLNLPRDVVRNAVNRMVKNKILRKENGMLSIENSIVLN